MTISFNEPVEKKDKLISLADPNPLFAPLDKRAAEERAVKYHVALGDTSPGLDTVHDMLQTPGGDESLRDVAVQKDHQDRWQIAVDSVKNATTESSAELGAIIEGAKTTTPKDYALERAYAEKVYGASMSMTNAPEELNAGADQMSQTMYDLLVEEQTKQEFVSKLRQDRDAKNQQAGWGTWAWNAGEQLLPLWTSTSQNNDALGEKMKSWLPGNNKQEQLAYLRTLPTDQFTALVKKIDEEMSASNPLEAATWLANLDDGYSSAEAGLDNFFSVLDVVTIPSLGTYKFAGRGIAKGVVRVATKAGQLVNIGGEAARIRRAEQATAAATRLGKGAGTGGKDLNNVEVGKWTEKVINEDGTETTRLIDTPPEYRWKERTIHEDGTETERFIDSPGKNAKDVKRGDQRFNMANRNEEAFKKGREARWKERTIHEDGTETERFIDSPGKNAKDVKRGDQRFNMANRNEEAFKKGREASGFFVRKLERTAAAINQPGAKPDEMLAGSGFVEEASKLRAIDIVRSMLPRAGKTVIDSVKDLMERTPMLYNPKAFFIDMSKSHLIRANEIADKLLQNQEYFVNAMKAVLNVQRIPIDVEQAALQAAADDFEREAKSLGHLKSLVGTIQKYRADSSGVNIAYIEAKYGTTTGGLYKSAKIAENAATNRLGLVKGTYSVTQEGDGFAIAVRKDIDETSEYVRQALITTENTSNTDRNKLFGFLPILPKSLNSAKDTVSVFQAEQRAALVHAHTAMAAYAKVMMEAVQTLGKREKEALTKIMTVERDFERRVGKGMIRGKFFANSSEFNEAYITHIGRLPTDNETAAYLAFRQQSDADYIFRSVNILKAKSRMGIVKLETTIGGKKVAFEGKLVDNIPFKTRYDGGVYVAIEKGGYRRLSENGLEKIIKQRAKEKDLKFMQVFNPDDPVLKKQLGVSGSVNFIVSTDARQGALAFGEQLPYRPGYHVRYKDSHYLKQGRISYDSSGRRIYSGDTALLGISNEAKGLKQLKLMERARVAVKAKDDVALQAVLDDGIPMTIKEFKQLFKERFDVNVPFSLVRSGQSAADPAVKTATGKSLAEEIGHFEDFSNSPYNLQKQMTNEYTGERDSPLWSINNEGTEDNPLWKMGEARTLDPMATQVEAMGRLVRDRHFQDYQMTSAESFVAEFGDMITIDGNNVIPKQELMRNPIYYTAHAVLKGDKLDRKFGAASTSLSAIQNLLTHRTMLGSSIAHIQGKLLSKAYERWGDKYVDAIDNWTGSLKGDLPSKMRAIAFHTKLGLFNPVQMALQAQTLAAMTAIAPKHGLQATLASVGMRRLALLPGDRKALEHMAEKIAKITPGWSKADFIESYDLLKTTGFDIIGHELSYRNDLADPKIYQSKTGKLLEWGSGIFNGTERFVRIASWNTAYKEYIAKFPKLAGKLTPQDARTILSRAQDLGMNMTRDAHAFWQEKEWSLMTQFWGYSMRMFDNLTGKRLTAGEKGRLLALNSLMYGIPVGLTPLLPIWPWDTSIRQMLQENGVDTNSGLMDPIMNGVLAASVSGLTSFFTGQDIQLNIGNRWGPNAIQVLYNLSETARGEDGVDELLSLLGGASGTIVSQIAADAYPMLKDIAYMVAAGGEGANVVAEDVSTAMKTVSTYNVLDRAWMAYNLGVYKTKAGQTIDPEYTLAEGIFHGATGIDPQSIQDTFLRYRSNREKQEFEYKIKKDAKKWIRLYFHAYDEGDYKSAEEYRNKATSWMAAGGLNEKQIMEAITSVRKEKDLMSGSIDAFVKAPNTQEEEAARRQMFEGSN